MIVDNTNSHIEATFNLLNVWNEITCDFTPDSELQADQIIYELQNPLKAPGAHLVEKQSPGGWDVWENQPVTLYCAYQYPCKNATFLWANLNYWMANTAIDGTGTDVSHWITADPTFTATGCTMIITNVGGW